MDNIRHLPRQTLLLIALCLAISAGIRWQALAFDIVIADDVVHVPAGHLTSYRPLLFLELLVWQQAVGSDYLMGRLPVLVAHAYFAIALWGLIRIARSMEIRGGLLFFFLAAITTSPVLNPYLVWHVFAGVSVSPLNFSNIVAGFSSQYLEKMGPDSGITWEVEKFDIGSSSDRCMEDEEAVMASIVPRIQVAKTGASRYVVCVEP